MAQTQSQSARPEPAPLPFKEIIKRITPYLPAIDKPVTGKRPWAAQFRAKHKIGEALQGRHLHGKVLEKVAKKVGRKPRWAYRLKIFADLYTQDDLDELCKLADKLNWGHVDRFLNVEKDEDRKSLQAEAAEAGWTNRQLEGIIRLRFKRRRVGGRSFRKCESPEAVLAQLTSMSQHWVQYYDTVVTSGKTPVIYRIEKMFVGKAAPELQEHLATAVQDLESLHKKSGDLLTKLRAIQSKARRGRKDRSKSK